MRREALRFIVLMGLVSMLADVTYEGARSVIGPFLLTLGAGSGTVGVVAGAAELAGYGVRVLSGRLADRTSRHWLFTGLGYAVNVLAVPALALAASWQWAALLMILERTGKAVRTPSRDAMLASASRQVGTGLGFGLHEALDQVGAVAGPLAVAAVLWSASSYRLAFGALILPALGALATLWAARLIFPDPATFEPAAPEAACGTAAGSGAARSSARGPASAPVALRLYLAFVALSTLGLVPFALVSYHVKARGLLADPAIPVLFAAAMAADAVAGLVCGWAYDRKGFGVLAVVPVATALAGWLSLQPHTGAVVAGVLAWSVALGMQESVLRAAVADRVPAGARGGAFGLFQATLGLAWFVGGSVLGWLYSRSAAQAAVYVLLTQSLALIPWWACWRQPPAVAAPAPSPSGR